MPDGNDIVTRLRVFNHHLMVEAADEIERLRKELEELEDSHWVGGGALQRFLEDSEDADANNEHFRTTDGE
jgi:hypothetical protein